MFGLAQAKSKNRDVKGEMVKLELIHSKTT